MPTDPGDRRPARPRRDVFRSLALLLPTIAAVLVLFGCARSPQDLLVGSWSPASAERGGQTLSLAGVLGASRLEFAQDGTFSATASSATLRGRYAWLEDGRVELIISEAGPLGALAPRLIATPTVSQESLTLALRAEGGGVGGLLGGGGGSSDLGTLSWTRAAESR